MLVPHTLYVHYICVESTLYAHACASVTSQQGRTYGSMAVFNQMPSILIQVKLKINRLLLVSYGPNVEIEYYIVSSYTCAVGLNSMRADKATAAQGNRHRQLLPTFICTQLATGHLNIIELLAISFYSPANSSTPCHPQQAAPFPR